MKRYVSSLVALAVATARWETWIAVLVCLLPVVGRPAQSVIDTQLLPAGRTMPNALGPSPGVRFGRKTPRVGDSMEQNIAHQVRMTSVWRQGNRIVNTTSLATDSKQRRFVTATRVERDRTTGVRVDYRQAVKRRAASDSPESAPEAKDLPISGKSYLCQRDGETVVITDLEGRVPPPEELELVSGDMGAVGLANPLVEYLAGKTVAIGETLSLPLEQADRLLGLRAELGQLTRFDLTLRESRVEDGTPCALFDSRIEANSRDSSQMHLQISGRMLVEIDTCRARSSELAGPIALSESRGSYSASMQVISTGRISLNLASSYRDAIP